MKRPAGDRQVLFTPTYHAGGSKDLSSPFRYAFDDKTLPFAAITIPGDEIYWNPGGGGMGGGTLGSGTMSDDKFSTSNNWSTSSVFYQPAHVPRGNDNAHFLNVSDDPTITSNQTQHSFNSLSIDGSRITFRDFDLNLTGDLTVGTDASAFRQSSLNLNTFGSNTAQASNLIVGGSSGVQADFTSAYTLALQNAAIGSADFAVASATLGDTTIAQSLTVGRSTLFPASGTLSIRGTVNVGGDVVVGAGNASGQINLGEPDGFRYDGIKQLQADNLYLGGDESIAGGSATLSISTAAAEVHVTNDLIYHAGASIIQETGHLEVGQFIEMPGVTPGSFQFTNNVNARDFAPTSFEIHNGSLSIGQTHALGTDTVLNPYMSIQLDNGTLNFDGTGVALGINGGTLDVSAIATIGGGNVHWGTNGGTLAIRSGNLTIDADTGLFDSANIAIPANSQIRVGDTLRIGQTGSSTLSLASSTGELSIGKRLVVGDTAPGTLTINNAPVSFDGGAQFQIGAQSGGVGYVSLFQAQQVVPGMQLDIGGVGTTAGGVGTLSMLDSTLDTTANMAGSAVHVYGGSALIGIRSTIAFPSLTMASNSELSLSQTSLKLPGAGGLSIDTTDAVLSGTLSIANVTGNARIGIDNAGVLSLARGAALITGLNSPSVVGVNAGGRGTVNIGDDVEADVSIWKDYGGVIVGQDGVGTININRGGVLNAYSLSLGSGTFGSVRVGDGAGAGTAALIVTNGIQVGGLGNATLSTTATSSVLTGSLSIGTTAISSARFAGELYVGHDLNVNDGTLGGNGATMYAGSLSIGSDTNVGTVDLVNSKFTTNSTALKIGYLGVSGGTFSTGSISVTENVNYGSEISVGNGGYFSAGNPFDVNLHLFVLADGGHIALAGDTNVLGHVEAARGGTITNPGSITIGSAPGSQGDMRVGKGTINAPSIVTTNRLLTVGLAGSGSLDIGVGGAGQVNAETLYVGLIGGSVGTINVSGTRDAASGNYNNGTLAVNGTGYLGTEGNATLAITGAGQASFNTLYLGDQRYLTANASVRVDGSDAGLTARNLDERNGVISVTSGGKLTASFVTLDGSAAAPPALSISGGGRVELNGPMTVGTGQAAGRVDVSGAGSHLLSPFTSLGFERGGQGTLTASNGALLTAEQLKVGDSGGHGFLQLTDSKIEQASLFVGYDGIEGGTFTPSVGLFAATNSVVQTQTYIGFQGGSGFASISGGSLPANSGTFSVGEGGHLSAANAFSPSNGTATFSSGANYNAGSFLIGYDGGSGTATLSNTTLSSDAGAYIGCLGRGRTLDSDVSQRSYGTLNLTNRSFLQSRIIVVGGGSGSGTINLTDQSRLETETLLVGNLFTSARPSAGSVSLSSGSGIVANAIQIGDSYEVTDGYLGLNGTGTGISTHSLAMYRGILIASDGANISTGGFTLSAAYGESVASFDGPSTSFHASSELDVGDHAGVRMNHGVQGSIGARLVVGGLLNAGSMTLASDINGSRTRLTVDEDVQIGDVQANLPSLLSLRNSELTASKSVRMNAGNSIFDIDHSVVQIGDSMVGSGNVAIRNDSSLSAGTIIYNGGNLFIDGTNTNVRSSTIFGNGTIVVSNGANVVVNDNLSFGGTTTITDSNVSTKFGSLYLNNGSISNSSITGAEQVDLGSTVLESGSTITSKTSISTFGGIEVSDSKLTINTDLNLGASLMVDNGGNVAAGGSVSNEYGILVTGGGSRISGDTLFGKKVTVILGGVSSFASECTVGGDSSVGGSSAGASRSANLNHPADATASMPSSFTCGGKLTIQDGATFTISDGALLNVGQALNVPATAHFTLDHATLGVHDLNLGQATAGNISLNSGSIRINGGHLTPHAHTTIGNGVDAVALILVDGTVDSDPDGLSIAGHGSLIGTGTVNAPLTMQPGSTLSIGNDIGKMSFTSLVSLEHDTSASVELSFDIGSDPTQPGTGFDVLALQGSNAKLTIDGAHLTLVHNGSVALNTPYAIIKAMEGAQIQFAAFFEGLTNHGVYDDGSGQLYRIDASATEIDVTFSSVPEPTVLSGLLAGASLAILPLRRRVA